MSTWQTGSKVPGHDGWVCSGIRWGGPEPRSWPRHVGGATSFRCSAGFAQQVPLSCQTSHASGEPRRWWSSTGTSTCDRCSSPRRWAGRTSSRSTPSTTQTAGKPDGIAARSGSAAPRTRAHLRQGRRAGKPWRGRHCMDLGLNRALFRLSRRATTARPGRRITAHGTDHRADARHSG